jgi:hypothetical protein
MKATRYVLLFVVWIGAIAACYVIAFVLFAGAAIAPFTTSGMPADTNLGVWLRVAVGLVFAGFAVFSLGIGGITWIVAGRWVSSPQLRLAIAAVPVVALVALRMVGAHGAGAPSVAPGATTDPLAAYTSQTLPVRTLPAVASIEQRNAAAGILSDYFDLVQVVTPFGSAYPIPRNHQTDLLIQAMTADGDIVVNGDGRFTVTPKGAAFGVDTGTDAKLVHSDAAVGGFLLGRYRVVAVDAIEKIPSGVQDFDAIRVHYRRTLEPTALGDTLLKAGWSNPEVRIGTTCSWETCLDAPRGFNQAARGVVSSIATLHYSKLTGWAKDLIDEPEDHTNSVAAITHPAPTINQALAPYETVNGERAAGFAKLYGLATPTPTATLSPPATPDAEQLKAAGDLIDARFAETPLVVDSGLAIGRKPASDQKRDPLVRDLIEDGDMKLDARGRVVALRTRPIDYNRSNMQIQVGQYHVTRVDGFERLKTTAWDIDCLLVSYRKSFVTNRLGAMLERDRWHRGSFNAATLTAGSERSTITYAEINGWAVGTIDADPANPDTACSTKF